jgi:hypothetical protein
MSDIVIIDIDSKIPNLALKKIEKYHLDKGDNIYWNDNLMASIADRTYVSCIFTKNKHLCDNISGNDVIIGGTGYDIYKKLPKEIDEIKPKINLGFTTRGCIRKCQFCFVPLKEGNIEVEGDIYDIWDGKAKELIIMDNNILALPEHFKLICKQLKKEKLKVDFNQGLDIRLLNDELAKEISEISHVSDVRFAWDNIKDEKIILKGIDILKNNKCGRAMFYVLVGFNSTFEEDLYRFNMLKSLGQRAYCMRHEKVKGYRKYNDLADWVNQFQFFASMDFERFSECKKNRKLLHKQNKET